MEETRPWGSYQILHESDKYKVKEIKVKPLSRLSLQSHKYRSEYWTCIEGKGEAQVNEERIKLEKNTQIFINKLDKHRLTNTSENEELVIIEIQHGTYFGEDDIIRYEDDYNRS